MKSREDQVDQGQVPGHRRGRRAHERKVRARVEEARESQAHQRTGSRHPELGPPVPGVLLELRDASEDEQGDRPGAHAVAKGDHGVPQLVEDDRDEEEKRRHEALRPVGRGGEVGMLRREVTRRQGPDDQAEDDQPAEVEVDGDPDHSCDLDVVRATAHAHGLPRGRAPRSREAPAPMVAVLVLDGLELTGDPMNAVHRVGVLDGAHSSLSRLPLSCSLPWLAVAPGSNVSSPGDRLEAFAAGSAPHPDSPATSVPADGHGQPGSSAPSAPGPGRRARGIYKLPTRLRLSAPRCRVRQARAKSMKPRSTSVCTSSTRTASPTSRPCSPRTTRPSAAG